MAWANSRMLELLGHLPDEAIKFSAWNPDWTVGTIVHHILIAEGRLISRVKDELSPEELDAPATAKGVYELSSLFSARDAELLSLIEAPERLHRFKRFGQDAEFSTSTILVQAVHHSAEHRAQISDILAANDMDVFNLDDVDLWAFEKWSEKSI